MAAVLILDQLKILAELQELDSQIYQQKKVLASLPVQVSALKTQQQKSSQEVQSVETKYKDLEVRRNQMEIDLGGKESQIRKLQTQLFQLKTNKEYSAMQRGIEGLKADQSVLEEEILKLMEEIDQFKSRLASERENLKAKESELQATLARHEDETRQIQSAIEQLQEARGTLTPKVDPPILSRYERILEHKEGLALVPVKGNACSGCHMVLPPQVINEIQIGTHLIACESCARILYIEPSQ